MKKQPHINVEAWLLLAATAWILIGAMKEFYQIAWGTGTWFGQFAPSWFFAFLIFGLFCTVAWFFLTTVVLQPQRPEQIAAKLEALRARTAPERWLIAACLVLGLIYALQYTFLGLVLHGPYLRIMLAIGISLIVSWLFTKNGFVDASSLLISLVAIGGLLSFLVTLGPVTRYPFSLGWSEGNRLWDYSILFARDIYLYPANQPIPVYLDSSRQLVGAIPFLIPGIKIEYVRLWLALINVIPYLVLGWVAFCLPGKRILPWLLAGVWAFTFVGQGPIHTPLLVCAIIVAFAWGRPLWLAIPLIFAAGYFAEISRFTWLFAPAMWAVMLEFAGADSLSKDVWRRATSVGIAGALGGYVAPFYLPVLIGWIKALGQPSSSGGVGTSGGVSLSSVQLSLTAQPLLWHRLLPNATYGPGILVGLGLATVPLIAVLIYLLISRRWQMNGLQKLSIVLPLLAFLIVGLIVSVKIGGGGDLHNLDMFIIGLLFAAAIAWRSGMDEWITSVGVMPIWARILIVTLIVVPLFEPLIQMKPLYVTKLSQLVATLADIPQKDPPQEPLLDTLPPDADTRAALHDIQSEVAGALPRGEILFMDQRQLLTFGYIENVPLVPEYDKKVLIDQAMAENAAYFENFYKDLRSQRFALIITSPLKRKLDPADGNFGEENNAWIKWVTKPLLCYYQPWVILKKVDVELLVPRNGPLDCASKMPDYPY